MTSGTSGTANSSLLIELLSSTAAYTEPNGLFDLNVTLPTNEDSSAVLPPVRSLSSKNTEALRSKLSGKSSILNSILLLAKLFTSTNSRFIAGTSLLKSSNLMSNFVPSSSGSHNLTPIFGEIPLMYPFMFIPPSSDMSRVIPSVQYVSNPSVSPNSISIATRSIA